MSNTVKQSANSTDTNNKKNVNVQRFRTQFNPVYKGARGKTTKGPSLTQPDMHLTIQELLLNHTRGFEMHEKQGIYSDTEIPDINDLNDFLEYKKQLSQQAKDLQEEIKHQKEELQKRKQANLSKEKQKDTPTPDNPTETLLNETSDTSE